MSTNTDTTLLLAQPEPCTTSSALPRREPTPQDPTPNWRTRRELPDDRRHWLMCPSTERYTIAKLTSVHHACRCGTSHDASVYSDGTLHCERTDSYFVATTAEPELKKMRRDFEDWFIALVRATELS